MFQYRKRYGLHAINAKCDDDCEEEKFQYRKRYGLHAIGLRHLMKSPRIFVSIPQAVLIACNRHRPFTAGVAGSVSIPQAVWIACNYDDENEYEEESGFNTASGMDCMQ